MVYMAFVVDDLAVDRRSVDWCRFVRWRTEGRSWRWRSRVLVGGDFFAVAVAHASLVLVAANGGLVIVIAAGYALSRALTFVRSWLSQSVRSRRWRARELTDDDFFAVAVAHASLV